MGADAPRLPASILRAVHRNGGARFAAKVFRRLGGTWPLFFRPDPSRSRASTLTAECHGITVHEEGEFPDGSVAPGRVPEILHSLEEALAGLRDPEGGPVFADVRRREEVYAGPRTREAAHLLLGPGRWGVSAALKALKNIPFVPHRTGIHSSEGIFLGFGPAFASGRLPGAPLSVTDVAPLIFHCLGEALPEGLDGALVPALLDSVHLAAHPPAFAPVTAPDRTRADLDAEAVQERLRGLGYMG